MLMSHRDDCFVGMSLNDINIIIPSLYVDLVSVCVMDRDLLDLIAYLIKGVALKGA